MQKRSGDTPQTKEPLKKKKREKRSTEFKEEKNIAWYIYEKVCCACCVYVCGVLWGMLLFLTAEFAFPGREIEREAKSSTHEHGREREKERAFVSMYVV